ncbi:MAG: hypothetical protein ACK4NR_09220 [Micavibrio sp.]
MNPFSLVIDTNFSVLGEPAVYKPISGTEKSINVMSRRPDELISFENTAIRVRTAIFDVRVSDIAAPAKGDEIVFKDTTYVVQDSEYIDGDRMIWRVDTYPK